jgi:hypothetical protein
MLDYKMNTKFSWAQTEREIIECFQKWEGITDWVFNYPKGAKRLGYDQTIEDRTATIEYKKNGSPIILTMDKQPRAIDNIRVLYKCIEEMRMQERRGVAEVFQAAYVALPSPTQAKERDPYEVLGVVQSTPLEVCEVVYKTLAKKAHTDTGIASDAKMKELNAAIAKIRGDQ